MNLVSQVFIVLAGAAVGSFLNVCIHRIPTGQSLIAPPSSCPGCGHPIRFYDNIPVLSFLLLKGKCRNCGQKISPRYVIVEVLTAVIALFIFRFYGFSLSSLAAFSFAAVLMVIAFIDLEHGIIPDIITLPGIPLFLFLAVFVMGIPFLDAFLGMASGAGLLYLVAVGYEFAAKRDGMGGGDINLFAMLGAFFGWQSLIFILLVSSLLGSVVGVGIMVMKKEGMKYAIPFGPFLSVAALAYLFWGYDLGWIMRLYW